MKTIDKTPRRRLPAGKLMLSYLTVIMAMSLIFSTVFYITSVHELDKRPSSDITASQPKDSDRVLDEWIGHRSDAGRASLGVHLMTLNLSALVIGGALSYWLARRTLRPIEKALQEQDQFIADASHELRTPITSALLSNEIALKNQHLTLTGAKRVLEDNIKDMQELKQLSDQLLYESGESEKSVSLSHIHVHHLVQDAIKNVTIIADKQKMTIDNTVEDIVINTDAERLKKVLVILIENAVKYSPTESVVTISSKQLKYSTDIIVSDHGIGIDKADLDTIFDRFYRSDHSRTKTTGYGLGLSIAKKLLKEMDATIKVKSHLDVGSDFIVSLPIVNTNETK